MARYRRKPTEIEAVQWDGTPESVEAIYEIGAEFASSGNYTIGRLQAGKDGAQGWIPVPVGHWVAKGIAGEFYPIDPDVFAATYEPVDDGEIDG